MNFAKAVKDLKEGFKLYPVWLYQAYHELAVRYKRTALGSIWIAGGYVSSSLAIAIVYGGLMDRNLHDVLPYIMAGFLAYGVAGYPLSGAPEMFMGAGSTIKNHAYPFTFFAFENLSRETLLMLHNLIVFFIFSAGVGAFKIVHWTLIPGLLIVLVSVFTWSTVIALMSARFRDLRFMLPFLSQLVFFCTPIIWHAGDMSRGKRGILADYNPMYGLIQMIRAPLLGENPTLRCWNLAVGTMIVGIIVWFFTFSAYRRRIPFWV